MKIRTLILSLFLLPALLFYGCANRNSEDVSSPGGSANRLQLGPGGRDGKITITDLNLTLVPIAPGKFMMGSPATDKDRDNDEIQHEVTLTQAYWLGETEITWPQYEAIMGRIRLLGISSTDMDRSRDFHQNKLTGTRSSKFSTWDNPSNFKGNHPVENVSWHDAVEFCQKLTERERAAGRLPDGQVYRLPTESEWEYAARAGTTTVFHYGDSLSSQQANFNGNYPYGEATKGPSLDRTTDVASYKPNAWGLYDMHGNVQEWCSDWYSDYPKGPVTDPTGPERGSFRVLRGGCYFSSAWHCRSAYRNRDTPTKKSLGIGFRIARGVPLP